MQTHSNSPEAVKKRLTAILDHHIKKIAEQMQREKRKVLAFNEALLEEWSEMLERIIFLKDIKPSIVKLINQEEKNQMPNIRYFPNPV